MDGPAFDFTGYDLKHFEVQVARESPVRSQKTLTIQVFQLPASSIHLEAVP